MSVLSDFICHLHGRFEALVESDSDFALCPVKVEYGASAFSLTGGTRICAEVSPWTPSPVAGRVELVSAVNRGKWEPPPTPTATNTRALMEGQSYGEWRKDRKKVWRDHDHKARKERG